MPESLCQDFPTGVTHCQNASSTSLLIGWNIFRWAHSVERRQYQETHQQEGVHSSLYLLRYPLRAGGGANNAGILGHLRLIHSQTWDPRRDFLRQRNQCWGSEGLTRDVPNRSRPDQLITHPLGIYQADQMALLPGSRPSLWWPLVGSCSQYQTTSEEDSGWTHPSLGWATNSVSWCCQQPTYHSDWHASLRWSQPINSRPFLNWCSSTRSALIFFVVKKVITIIDNEFLNLCRRSQSSIFRKSTTGARINTRSHR